MKKQKQNSLNITEVKFMKRRNLGNWESEEVTFTAAGPELNPTDTVAKLRELAEESLGGYLANETDEESTAPKKKKKAPVTVELEDEESPKSKSSSNYSKTTGTSKKAKKATAETPTKRKSKGTLFDGDKELHKNIIGKLMDEEYPKWRKKNSMIRKAKRVSTNMRGEEFLDSNSTVLPEFRANFLDNMEG